MLPLGVRLNNLGNLRASNNFTWLGQIGVEKGFCKFSLIFYGLRALAKQIATYYDRGWCDSAKEFVKHYAPGSDGNNESAYVNYISSAWNNGFFYPKQLICLVIEVEQGKRFISTQNYFDAKYLVGVAFSTRKFNQHIPFKLYICDY